MALPEELDRLRENYLQLLALVSSDPPQMTAEEAKEEIREFTVTDREGMIWFMETDGYFYSEDPESGERTTRNPEDFIARQGGESAGFFHEYEEGGDDGDYSYQFSSSRNVHGEEDNAFSSEVPASALDTDDWAAGIASLLPPVQNNGGLTPNDYGMSSPHFGDVRLEIPKPKNRAKKEKKSAKGGRKPELYSEEPDIEEHPAYSYAQDDFIEDEQDEEGFDREDENGIDLSFGQAVKEEGGPVKLKSGISLGRLSASQRKLLFIGGLGALVVVLILTNGGGNTKSVPKKGGVTTTLPTATTVKAPPGAAVAPPQSYISTVIKSLLNTQSAQSVLSTTASPMQLSNTATVLNGYLSQGLEIAFGPFHYTGLTSGNEVWSLRSGGSVVGEAHINWTYTNGVWLITALPNFSSV